MPFDGDIKTFEQALKPPPETEAQRMIRRARERIAVPQRWVKGALRSHGRMCLLGALEPEMWTAVTYVERAIRLEGHPFSSIPRFNDHPATRHADVLRVLDRAYALAAETSEPNAGLLRPFALQLTPKTEITIAPARRRRHRILELCT